MTASTSQAVYKEKETFYVPYFEIKVRGNPMPRSVVRDIIEVTYEDSIEKVDSFTLAINNWDAGSRQPKYIGMKEKPKAGSDEAKFAAIFDPGNELALYMGYRGNLRLMMSGFITTLDVDFPDTSAPRLTVRGLNILDKFRQKQYTWTWPPPDKKFTHDSEIAKDLGRPPDEKKHRPGLGIEVRVNDAAAAKEPREPYVMMNNLYPIVFLMERARRRGYSVFVGEELKNKKPHSFLYFGPTQALRDVTYTLEWGKSLTSFHPALVTTNQVSEVSVFAWDRRAKARIEGIATLADCKGLNEDLHDVVRVAGRKEVITDHPVHTPEEAKAFAKDFIVKQMKEIVQASGATVGLPDLRAGRTAMIEGVGYRLRGRYFLKETTHVINESGYRTTFRARREELGAKKP